MRAPEFWHRPDAGAAALLSPLSYVWRAAGALRRGLTRPWRAPVPVVCVGNLVVGGAGKTPVALSLAANFGARGAVVHMLSRGYGGTLIGPVRVDPAAHSAREVGDEPLLLARATPTWVARDRAAGARAAVAAGAGLLVMDDGFQNPSLAKDISLLVVDGGYGFGNGRVVPAGPLREPVEDALARATAVVILGEDRCGIATALRDGPPVLRARLRLDGAGDLAGKRVLPFAGVGRPGKFYESLRELGCDIVAHWDFPNHHPYKPEEIMAVWDEARARDAIIVTTAKDFVRLPEDARTLVRAVEVTVDWADEAALARLLAPLPSKGGG